MLLQKLRTETRAYHDRLEARLPLMRDDLSLVEYVRVLEQFHSFCVPWEQSERQALPEGLRAEFARRTRLPRLERDLRHFGRMPAAPQECPLLPSLTEPGAAMGSWYVLEGATLGGQFLTRRLGPTLGLSPEAGLAYFSGYGAATGAEWRAFLALLEENVPPGAHDGAVAGACATFAALEQWLTAAEIRFPAPSPTAHPVAA